MNRQLVLKIYETINKNKKINSGEKIIISCVLYKYIMSLTDTYADRRNSLSSLVDTYAGIFTDKVLGIKNKYISYNLMIKEVYKIKKDNFTKYEIGDIDKIYKLYLDKTVITLFDTSYFSQYMYKILYLRKNQYNYLSQIHFDIMCPIIEYYIDKYGISASDMEIFDAMASTGIPGKEIIFSIQDIPLTEILSDILSKNINIDYYSVSIKGNYIALLLN